MPDTNEREKLLAEIIRELQGMQSDWTRIAQKVTLKVRSRFREIEGRLQGRPGGAKAGARELRQAQSLVRDLRIKPDKARAKDLLRIERLLEELSELFPEDDG
jgi:hypothetical protein